MAASDLEQEFWLFGYGSLIWKPPPHFDKRIPGWVIGYVRRFWQASDDHRGTPESPGRVVTLIDRSYWEELTDHHEPPERVWGVAYRIKAEHVAEVKENLGIRETNYIIRYTPFVPADGSATIQTLVFISPPGSPHFVGPQDPQELAELILRSKGLSGYNVDYLLGLNDALEELAPDSGDIHISDLASRIRTLQQIQDKEQAVTAATSATVKVDCRTG